MEDMSNMIYKSDSPFRLGLSLQEEIRRFSEVKKQQIENMENDDEAWKESIKVQIEAEIDRRVREALDTPPLERYKRKQDRARDRYMQHLSSLNNHITLDLTDKERDFVRRREILEESTRRVRFADDEPKELSPLEKINNLTNPRLQPEPEPSYDGMKARRQGMEAMNNFNTLTKMERLDLYYLFTRKAFQSAVRRGRLPDGSQLDQLNNGKYRDKYGIVRDQHGPFWPPDYGPLFAAPVHTRKTPPKNEPMTFNIDKGELFTQTFENQPIRHTNKWRGVQIVFDSEKSPRDCPPLSVSEGTCPSLKFESRFESGNLRQARRIGQYEYELVLKTDLYTNRHTQWFYFRVENAVPGISYKFIIINFLKPDSLYNHGMRPLFYSETNSKEKGIGWVRNGHHIFYSRNMTHTHCPLLPRERSHFMLEWQMEFPNPDDVCYLAHCYPYTYTDLKDDLDFILEDTERSKWCKREVLCETRAGNSCFLCTVTDFSDENKIKDEPKPGVIVTARVHPGESNASWMMKGLLDFLTSNHEVAAELRRNYIFKIVPMLNPDGVIVGNYRCSLAARDLNRNYRHPRRDNFPTIFHVKEMMEEFSQTNPILIYCDLHGHSRKQNVFMYGCDTSAERLREEKLREKELAKEREQREKEGIVENGNEKTETENKEQQKEEKKKRGRAASFIDERLFPYLMSKKAPKKFSFKGCKFAVRRCKESTGRVVMFRSFKIMNSFTMEATFCGSDFSREEARHFNMEDFQEMGRVFGETVIDYKKTKANKEKHMEAVIDITRVVAEQIIEKQGFDPSGLDLSNNNMIIDECDPSGEKANQLLNDLLEKHLPKETTTFGNNKKTWAAGEGKVIKEQLAQVVDDMSIEALDSCYDILDKLNAADVAESESSDSDSESEAEMPVEVKSKKKKKKNKKTRDKLVRDAKERKKDDEKPKSTPGLPFINPDFDSTEKKKKIQTSNVYTKKKTISTYPHFVSKYRDRTNNGIPCFSEERSMERAARRMLDMRRRNEEQKRRESYQALFCSESDTADQNTTPPQVDPSERYTGTGNIAQQLIGYRGSVYAENNYDYYRDFTGSDLENNYIENNCRNENYERMENVHKNENGYFNKENSDSDPSYYEDMDDDDYVTAMNRDLHQRLQAMHTPYQAFTPYTTFGAASQNRTTYQKHNSMSHKANFGNIPPQAHPISLDPIKHPKLSRHENMHEIIQSTELPLVPQNTFRGEQTFMPLNELKYITAEVPIINRRRGSESNSSTRISSAIDVPIRKSSSANSRRNKPIMLMADGIINGDR